MGLKPAVVFMVSIMISTMSTADTQSLSGPYLGQEPPENQARVFAPGIVSSGFNDRDMAMMPDGSEIYWAVNMRNFEVSTILNVQRVNNNWTEPQVAAFATDSQYKFLEPAISPDGSKFFFVKSANDGNNNDIWVMDRTEGGWGEPRKLGPNINTDVSETFPSITNDGTLYFSRAGDDSSVEHIYRSRWVDDKFSEPERLPSNVNSGKTQFNAFVAADETYLIVSVYGREDSIGSIDYYIVFRNEKDEWSAPVNMGEKVNTAGGQEYSAYVSRDGKYLFFMSTRTPSDDAGRPDSSLNSLHHIHNSPENGNSDIYWMSADIIEDLRPDGF